jgi:uncharacterized lipoprotein NlpE involved in copper resistance
MKTGFSFIKFTALALAIVAVASCKNGNSEAGYSGTYHAIMPAADCPGINTILRLDTNGTYIIDRVYIDRSNSAYQEKGKYTVSGDRLTLISDENDTTSLKAVDGLLKWLDRQGNEITGDLAGNYTLKPGGEILWPDGNDGAYLTGDWVEPVPGMPGHTQGVSLKEDGTAESINMATLRYEQWDRTDNILFLKGKSIGNGQTIDFTDTLLIKGLTADSLTVIRDGVEIRYARKTE